MAVTTLLDGQAQAPPGAAADGLDEVMGQRAEVFQAQGMVSVQLRVTLSDALARLRAHAYAEDRALGEVARDVVARRLSFGSGQS
ncbi:ANTAR domain-containing protein [Paractinoplanes durhamensis]|uniref:ANTAR domain-containing protein n=1 Tax=Paractinoplanes durhamensis TaxID=113563 RepID=UPI00362E1A39